MFSKLIAIFLLSSLCHWSFADLTTSINQLLEDQGKNETIGVYVETIAPGSVLYSYNGNLPMTPASTTKAFTAAAAYLFLGPDYHYVTTISTNAKMAKTLSGNVYIHFSGDPTLSSVDLDALIDQMRIKGVHMITGNVILDETVFSGSVYGQGWGLSDFENCYGAPITGAIINSDCSRYGVVRDPNVYAEDVVRAALKNAGIRLQGQVIEGKMPVDTVMIAAHNSDSLQAILGYMLKYSDDVYANAVFKTMGDDYFHAGSYVEGARATHAILAAHFGVLFKKSPLLNDGSGLSTENLISPQQLVVLYRDMYADTALRGMFMKSLAISGQPGTLVYRLDDRALRGRVYAKTGTFEHDKGGVSNLAGYLILPGHSPIAFAVMVNHTDADSSRAQALQDQIVRLIAKDE